MNSKRVQRVKGYLNRQQHFLVLPLVKIAWIVDQQHLQAGFNVVLRITLHAMAKLLR
jgi:hypothetical protein